MLSREERILSELLLSRGIVSKDRLEACARRKEASTGTASLADYLVDGGILDAEGARKASEEARALEVSLAPDLPGESRLGEFRLVREIGRGGMGIVYEAEQEPLGRRVALKVLPAGAALDERLSIRFLKEARAAARLDHPGIVSVFTSGRAQGVLYFAMELIEGRSLAEVAAEGPLDPDSAARIGAAVARALDHAHAGGLVHRDVKPENILLGPDGRPRITDFGLVHEASAASFTLSHHVLGTPAFIAPEQAIGEPVDLRSDVYGLGAVLYNLLTGRAPYAGELPSVVLGRVLTAAPDPIRSVRPEIPPALAEIVERAMARRREDRYPSALAMAEALEAYLRGDAPSVPPPRRFGVFAAVAIVSTAALVLLLLIVPALKARGRRLSPPAPSASPGAPAPSPFALLATLPGRCDAPRLSPDGTRLVYARRERVYSDVVTRALQGGESVDVTGDSTRDETMPTFSPDGRTLAYSTGSRGGLVTIETMDLATHRKRALVPFGEEPEWSPDGREIVFVTGTHGPGGHGILSRLWKVDVATGNARLLNGIDASSPAWSPSGARIAFASQSGGQVDIWTIAAQGGEATRLTNDTSVDWGPVWSADGGTVTFGSDREGSYGIWSVAIDQTSGRPAGPPRRVTDAALAAPFLLARSAKDGRITIASNHSVARLHRLRFDPDAGLVQGAPVAFPRRFTSARSPDVSPDGRLLVFAAQTPQENIAVQPTDVAAEPVLITQEAHDRAPRWSRDGKWVAFASDRGGTREIFEMSTGADGSILRRVVAMTDGQTDPQPVWSPDGKTIAVGARLVDVSSGLGVGVEPRTELLPPLESGGDAKNPASGTGFQASSWSPDGTSIAGTSRGIVVYDIARRTYRRLTAEGERPVWMPDGRRLLYTSNRNIYLVDAEGGEPKEIFSAAPGGIAPGIGISPDGRTLYVSLTASPDEVWTLTPPPASP